jgi:hypothetical protein
MDGLAVHQVAIQQLADFLRRTVMSGTDRQEPNGPKHFTRFSSAAEEALNKRSQDHSDLEGGHMSSERGRIVHTPGSDLAYKAVLTHDASEDTERAFATMREAEAFIKRNTPVPTPRRTTYDRDAPKD